MNSSDGRHPFTLMDLDDDCLWEIFKYFSILETFSLLGHLNKRLDEIAFSRLKNMKSLTINIKESPNYSPRGLSMISKNLKSLYISATYSLPPELTLYYLRPLCGLEEFSESLPSFEHLTLHYVEFNEEYLKCIRRIAPNLKNLDLSYCQLNDELLVPILECAVQLQELTLIGNYTLNCSSLHCLKTKDLKVLQLQLIPDCIDNVNDFIEKNPQTKIFCYGPDYGAVE